VILKLGAVAILTRVFRPDDYGLYSLVLAAVAVLKALLTSWLFPALIRFSPACETEAQLGEFYTTAFGIGGPVIMGGGLLAALVAFVLRPYSSSNPLLVYGAILLFIAQSTLSALLTVLRARRMVTQYTLFSLWQLFIGFFLGLTFIWLLGAGVSGMIWGGIVASALAIPLAYRVALRRLKVRFGVCRKPAALEMLKYGLPLVPSALFAWVLSLSDRYILGYYRGSDAVGIYSASYSVANNSILVLVSLFAIAAGPLSMQMWERKGREASRVLVSTMTRYYILVCLPAAVGLSVLAVPLLRVLVSDNYLAGSSIIPMVAFGAFLFGLQGKFQTGLLYMKKTSLITLAVFCSGILNILLNMLLIPRFGYIAAGFSTLISYAVLLALMVCVSQRFFTWRFPFDSLARATISSAVMAVVVYLVCHTIGTSVVWKLVLSVPIGVLVYFSSLYLLGEFTKQELQQVWSFLSGTRRG